MTVHTLQAGDDTYQLEFDVNGLCDLENELDQSIMRIAEKLADARIDTYRAVLWAALRLHHPGVKFAQATEIMVKAGVEPVAVAAGGALKDIIDEMFKPNPEVVAEAARKASRATRRGEEA